MGRCGRQNYVSAEPKNLGAGVNFRPCSEGTDKRTNVWSQDFMIWKINSGQWVVDWAGLWNKRVWADYEQLFGVAFSCFQGQKKNKILIKKDCRIRTKKLHKMKLNIIFIFHFFDPENIKKLFFFRANTQILKSECTT